MVRIRELAVMQNDFSASCDRLNHSGLLFKLRDVRVGDAVFNVFAGFLIGTILWVVFHDERSEGAMVDSGDPQSSVLGPLQFLLYMRDLPMIQDNTLLDYEDDSILLDKVPTPSGIAILLELVTGANAEEYW